MVYGHWLLDYFTSLRHTNCCHPSSTVDMEWEEMLIYMIDRHTERACVEMILCLAPPYLRQLVLKPSQGLSAEDVVRILYKCCHLKGLSLEDCEGINVDAVVTLTRPWLTSLVTLNLAGCQTVTDKHVQELLKTCHGLRHVSVKNTEVTDSVFLLHPSLQSQLELTGQKQNKGSNPGWQCGLRTVDVSGCVRFTNIGLLHLASLTGPSLHSLLAQQTQVDFYGLLYLMGHSKLSAKHFVHNCRHTPTTTTTTTTILKFKPVNHESLEPEEDDDEGRLDLLQNLEPSHKEDVGKVLDDQEEHLMRHQPAVSWSGPHQEASSEIWAAGSPPDGIVGSPPVMRGHSDPQASVLGSPPVMHGYSDPQASVLLHKDAATHASASLRDCVRESYKSQQQNAVSESSVSQQYVVLQSLQNSVAQSSTAQVFHTTQNDVTQSSAPPQNDVTQSSAPPQNDVTQSFAPPQNDTQSSAPPQNDVTQSSTSPQNDVTQSTAPPQNDVTQSSTSLQNDVTQSSTAEHSPTAHPPNSHSVTQDTVSPTAVQPQISDSSGSCELLLVPLSVVESQSACPDRPPPCSTSMHLSSSSCPATSAACFAGAASQEDGAESVQTLSAAVNPDHPLSRNNSIQYQENQSFGSQGSGNNLGMTEGSDHKYWEGLGHRQKGNCADFDEGSGQVRVSCQRSGRVKDTERSCHMKDNERLDPYCDCERLHRLKDSEGSDCKPEGGRSDCERSGYHRKGTERSSDSLKDSESKSQTSPLEKLTPKASPLVESISPLEKPETSPSISPQANSSSPRFFSNTGGALAEKKASCTSRLSLPYPARMFSGCRLCMLSFSGNVCETSAGQFPVQCFRQFLTATSPKLKHLQLQLTELNLAWCEDVEEEKLNQSLILCPCLVSLRLRLCKVTNGTLRILARHCTAIESLDIAGGQELEDEGVVCLALALPGLTTLDLSNNGGLGDASVRALLMYCPCLKTVNFSCLSRITSLAFMPIVAGGDWAEWVASQRVFPSAPPQIPFPTLRLSDHVMHSKIIREWSVLHRSSVYGRSLSEVDLTYCNNMDDRGIKGVVTVCRGGLRVTDYYNQRVMPYAVP
ncbi:hypothetical protein ACOMHN_047169 [Nucella lapillus]